MENLENLGFIRDKLDIKILILYILEKLPAPVDGLVLADLVLFDGGFNWFDYSQCLADLVQTEHVVEQDGSYEITDKGRRNVGYVGSSLPYSVRAKADRLATPVAAALRRQSMIETASEPSSNGGYTVSLRMSDGVGEIISMHLAVPDETQAKAIEGKFRKDAEDIFNKIITMLTDE